MKKAIIVLLIAVVAMTAVFANTSDKDGFAIKAGALGYAGEYGVAYRLEDFEFGLNYYTYGLPLMFMEMFYDGFEPRALLMAIVPVGGMATVEYKFVSTEQHEVGAILEAGFNGFIGGFTATIGVEYDYCFNANHAAFAKLEAVVFPFIPSVETLLFGTMIGYRYTF